MHSATGVGVATSTAQHDSSRGHELAKLSHHVVSRLIDNSATADRNQALAGSASTAGKVWAIARVGAESPCRYANGPVLQRTHGEICCLVPCSGWRPALGHVLLHGWVAVVELGEHCPVQGVGVAMPGDRIDILASTIDDGLGVVGVILQVSKKFHFSSIMVDIPVL